MERFVRHLFQTIPIASLTQRIVRDRYKAEFSVDQGFTANQAETLRSIVVDFAKAEMDKGFKLSIIKSRLKDKIHDHERGIEEDTEELARIEERKAKLEERNARRKKELATMQILQRFQAVIDRTLDDAPDFSEQIESLRELSLKNAKEVFKMFQEDVDRISDDFSYLQLY
ncbi:Oidioi.mRNA.OKI2018_I69.chr2.g5803.t1.cds [Oikopleura dioica]|uniref:Oidioi.mRNA.OKI2018_I69.chr2.g5803.t1.cds n=1 Tax=Oikopleura dioica TaxID=34765 RepID=A0ABN7T0X7_OIKDI|nr:Oidioi.mRNA.OKI2018_I69.chr2.g5803.t1.cds [Oikopleura dioica]